MTHVFAGFLCHALYTCVAHAQAESCSSFLLVYRAFRACYRNCLPLLHHVSLQQKLSIQTPILWQPLWATRWYFCCSLDSSSFAPRKSVRQPFKFWWWLLLLLVLLEIVIYNPWLRVYVAQIHIDLSSRLLAKLNSRPRNEQFLALTN
jgi:hypothetical protein